MIHVRSRSTFGYLFNLNHKRIACHESYTERSAQYEVDSNFLTLKTYY